MDKKYYLKGISLAMALMMSASFYGCSNKTNAADSKNTPVAKTAEAAEDYSNAFSGKVKPASDVDIVSKISGRIATINFKEGQEIKAGDILFTLEDKDIRLQVNQAEAAVNAARANYTKVTGSAVDQQSNQNKSSLELAQTEYNNAVAALEEEKRKEVSNTAVKTAEVKLQDAQSILSRKQQLFDAGAVSQQDLDTATNNFNYAQDQLNNENTAYSNARIAKQQALDTAEARVKKAEEGLRAAREQQDKIQSKSNQDNANIALTQLKQSEAAYETAKSQLDNTVYRSPASGIVAAKNAEVGEMVGTTTVIAKVVDISTVSVEVNVQENMVNKLKVGDKVKVLIKSADSEPLEGEITSINPIADAKAQSYPVKIKVGNENGLLKGDMFAEVLFN